VLADLKMPGMDDLRLLAQLRNADPNLPVVVVTAFGGVDTPSRVMRLGAFDCLTKPVSLGELLKAVDRVMEHRRTRA
jgi:DNA-binding NtrC family response regulator